MARKSISIERKKNSIAISIYVLIATVLIFILIEEYIKAAVTVMIVFIQSERLYNLFNKYEYKEMDNT